MSASEFYEAGMALPPSVRKDVALRLLQSLESPESPEALEPPESPDGVDQDAIDNEWADETSSRIEDLVMGTVETIPAERVFADMSARLAAREISPTA